MPLDLSHIFTGDPDQGQQNHADAPHELKMHIAHAFAAHAGLRKSPGEYTGPEVKPPDDWENPESDYQQGLLHEQQALSNISEGENPVIPSPKAKAGQSVSDAFKNWDPSSSK